MYQVLDTKTAIGYVEPAAGKIRRSGLEARNTEGGHTASNLGGFFVSGCMVALQLGASCGGPCARRLPSVPVFQPVRRALFAFGSVKRGLYPQPKEKTMPNPYPPQVYPDRPQDSLDESIYKITFLSEVLTQPTPKNERFSLSEDGQMGLYYIFAEIRAQLRASSEALLAKLRAKEA
jgi:hypothetical protein